MKYIASVYTIKSKLPFGDKSRAKIVVEEASSTYIQMSSFRASGFEKTHVGCFAARGILEIVIERRE